METPKEIMDRSIKEYGFFFEVFFIEHQESDIDTELEDWIKSPGCVGSREEKCFIQSQILLFYTKLRLKEIGLEDLIPNLTLEGDDDYIHPELVLPLELTIKKRWELLESFSVPFLQGYDGDSGKVIITPNLRIVTREEYKNFPDK